MRLADLQRRLVIDSVIAHAPSADHGLASPAKHAGSRAHEADDGISHRLGIGEGKHAHGDDATERAGKCNELLYVHAFLENDEREDCAHGRIERRDDSRVPRTDVVDGDDVTGHANRATQQRAEHDHLAATGAQRSPRVLETPAHAHVERKPQGAEDVMQRRRRDCGKRERLERADIGRHRERNAQDDRVESP